MKKISFVYLLMFFMAGTVSHSSETIHVEVPIFDEIDVQELPPKRQQEVIFRSRPFINSHWKFPPDIRLCTASGVSETRLGQAMQYWNKLGYTFGSVIIDDNSITCVQGGTYFEITILLVTNDIPIEANLALTKTYIHRETRELTRARIYINSRAATKERVLEHEIGHAMGWSHFNRKYHMMNRDYRLGGHDSTGLTKREYDYQISDLTSE